MPRKTQPRTRRDTPGLPLSVTHPQLANEFHPELNGDNTPENITKSSREPIIWQCSTNKLHVWKARLRTRVYEGGVCPRCNDQPPITVTHPEVAAQFHPTLNGDLSPENLIRSSHESVVWVCEVDPVEHVWTCTVHSRVFKADRVSNCPFCTGNKIAPSNSLARHRPDIASMWHKEKNKDLTAFDVAGLTVWWQCPTGAKDHEWEAKVCNVVNGDGTTGCPCCANKKVAKDNCLKTVYPLIAAMWHPTMNGQITPADIVATTHKEFWWKCNSGHVFKNL